MKGMNNMTPEEILEQHKLTQELFERLRDVVGDYTQRLVPMHIFGAIESVKQSFSHWNSDQALKRMAKQMEDQEDEGGFSA